MDFDPTARGVFDAKKAKELCKPEGIHFSYISVASDLNVNHCKEVVKSLVGSASKPVCRNAPLNWASRAIYHENLISIQREFDFQRFYAKTFCLLQHDKFPSSYFHIVLLKFYKVSLLRFWKRSSFVVHLKIIPWNEKIIRRLPKHLMHDLSKNCWRQTLRLWKSYIECWGYH